eukprot:scaffold431_cov160-Isochrysis_galbana.AAC.3
MQVGARLAPPPPLLGDPKLGSEPLGVGCLYGPMGRGKGGVRHPKLGSEPLGVGCLCGPWAARGGRGCQPAAEVGAGLGGERGKGRPGLTAQQK